MFDALPDTEWNDFLARLRTLWDGNFPMLAPAPAWPTADARAQRTALQAWEGEGGKSVEPVALECLNPGPARLEDADDDAGAHRQHARGAP